MQDLKYIFKSKSKKSVRKYKVNGIQIKGLSLNEKIYILLSVKRLFSPTLLLLAIDSMTDIQR